MPSDRFGTDYKAWLWDLRQRDVHGAGDRYGTANYIDRAARRRAADCVSTGETVSLCRPMLQQPAEHDGRPKFTMTAEYTEYPGTPPANYYAGMSWAVHSDHIQMDSHNPHHTHLDGLNHMVVDGGWYHGAIGRPAGPSMTDLADYGLFTRAVFADIPQARGSDWVSEDEPVAAADIERALSLCGATFQPGDALLLYQGRDELERTGRFASSAIDKPRPGVGASAAEWIADNKVSILCWDFHDAVHPKEPPLAAHMLIWAIGQLIVDNCDFSRLRPIVRESPVGAGALSVAPLPIDGGTGCPVNPQVMV